MALKLNVKTICYQSDQSLATCFNICTHLYELIDFIISDSDQCEHIKINHQIKQYTKPELNQTIYKTRVKSNNIQNQSRIKQYPKPETSQ